MNRREALAYLSGAGIGLGAWRAIDNVVLGYGRITGTNVVEQELRPLVNERLRARGGRHDLDSLTLVVGGDGEAMAIDDGDDRLTTFAIAETTPEEAAEIDDALGLDDRPLEGLVADLRLIDREGVSVDPLDLDAFFERVRSGETQSLTVDVIRGRAFAGPPPELVEEFTGADPTRPEAVVAGLVESFREHASYDVPRYLAGSVEDNVLAGQVDLRQHFEEPWRIESMVEGSRPGLFCTELTVESARALHAVSARQQRTPVAAAYVRDARHKHAFTAITSLLREDGELVMPLTFVDYTYTTLYDDLRVTGLLGDGLAAYDTRHRADEIYWSRWLASLPT